MKSRLMFGKSELISIFAVISLLFFGVSCKQQSKPSKPPSSGAEETGGDRDDDDDPYDPGDEEDSSDATVAPRLYISPRDVSGTLFEYDSNETIEIAFEVSGASDEDDVIVALYSLPEGMSLSGSSLKPVVKWHSPKEGSHSLKFLLRDRERCERDSSDCRISSSEYGNLTKKSYDVLSDLYTIRVGDQTTNNNNNNNNDMINQILSIVGPLGGDQLLSQLGGLSTAQLQQILNMSNGGGLDISAIMSLIQSMGGLSLTGDKDLPPKEVLQEIVRVYKLNHPKQEQ